ncbi:MAG: hypothetical protein EBS35_03220 [Bacteroidetes bacterium]|nr:hypothetical protein [Bacteroidota bacterium]
MKLIKCFFPCLIIVFAISLASGQASSGLKYQKQPVKEPSVISSKIWYGGGLNLGFSGQSGLNVLQLGASPMVGYKILPRWSIGPRVSFLASRYSGRAFINKITPINWGVGVFTRIKIIQAIFAHAEYEIANEAFISFDGPKLYADRLQQNNVYVGGGYSSGQGNTKFEIVALYNLQTPESTLYYISPFTFRFGFTVNF